MEKTKVIIGILSIVGILLILGFFAQNCCIGDGSYESEICETSSSSRSSLHSINYGTRADSDPYGIWDIFDLQNIAYDLSAHYILMDDIDASETIGWNGGAGFKPIGDYDERFSGILDGQDHTIRSLTIYRPSQDYVGLFGTIEGGRVQNLNIEAALVIGRDQVGVLAGYAIDSAFDNCTIGPEENGGYVIGWCTVMGVRFTGGMVGHNAGNGNVTECTSEINLSASGGKYIGGLVGLNSGTIDHCSHWTQGYEVRPNIVLDTDSDSVGGLVGLNFGTIKASESHAWIQIERGGTAKNIGGLVGRNVGTISDCFWYGFDRNDHDYPITLPSGVQSFGGLVGYNDAGFITSSLSNGSLVLDGGGTRDNPGITRSIGGLVGDNSGEVTMCESSTGITLNNVWMYFDKYFDIGGLVGENIGIISRCSYSGTIKVLMKETTLTIKGMGGLVGKNGNPMGKDIGTVHRCSSSGNIDLKFWYYSDIEDFDVGCIGGLVGLTYGKISHSDSTMSIDMITEHYSGRHNWVIQDIGGLVGRSENSIDHCSSTGPDINIYYDGTVDHIGGLVGYSDTSSCGSDITNCNSTRTIDITGMQVYQVGGLIGENWNSSIYNSFWEGDIKIGVILESISEYGSRIGGLAGISKAGIISECVSTGSIVCTGFQFAGIGGMVGENVASSIINCHSRVSIKIDGGVWHHGRCAQIGGLCGMSTGTIKFSSATGIHPLTGGIIDIRVNVKDCYDIGGLVGQSCGNITDSYSHGDIYVKNHLWVSEVDAWIQRIGGLVGELSSTTPTTNCILNSYSRATVVCQVDDEAGMIKSIGGLVGKNTNQRIQWSYSVGYIGLFGGSGREGYGTFVGWNTGWVEHCVVNSETYPGWDILGWNDGTYIDITKQTTAEMILKGTFETKGFNFVYNWTIIDKLTYPFLKGIYHEPRISFLGETDASEDMFFVIHYKIATSEYPLENTPYPYHEPFKTTMTLSTDADSWLHWDPATYSLSGTPSNDDVGVYYVQISVTDQVGTVSRNTITIEVVNINDSPKVITPDDLTATEDQLYQNNYTATDIDPTWDDLRWHLRTNALWLSIDSSTGKLSGTPDNADVGTYWVNVSVSDGRGGKDHSNFTLTVENTNDPPNILTKDIPICIEDEPYRCLLEAVDIDPVPTRLTWGLMTNAEWLSMKGNYLYGSPTNDDVGEYWVRITVSDSEGGSDNRSFMLVVLNSNDAPIIGVKPKGIAMEDETYETILTAYDPDADDTLQWTVESGPSWLSIVDGTLTGVPTNVDVGISWVEVRVTDEAGAYDQLAFKLSVKNVNDAPEWVKTPGDQDVMEGDPIVLASMARDIDMGDSLKYNIISAPASNISIDSSTGVISWNEPIPGEFMITLSVTDGIVTVKHTFSIIVREIPPIIPPPNRLPIVDSVDNIEVETGRTIVFNITAIDQDGDELFFKLDGGLPAMSISSDGKFVWTPHDENEGTHTVTVLVSDSVGSTKIAFSITVKASQSDGSADGTGNLQDTDKEAAREVEAALDGVNIVLAGLIIVLVFIIMRRK